jgi:hypothetical protein
MFRQHLERYAGKPVIDWDAKEKKENKGAPPPPSEVAYRIGLSYGEADENVRWTDKFAAFLDQPRASETTALVVGAWDMLFEWDADCDAIVQALVAARDRLPNLEALFFGDVTYEESEISWIVLGDFAPLFLGYPELDAFAVRGGQNLRLGTIESEHLRSLTVQSGGLDVSVVHQITGSKLPALEHLELWLGSESYGANATLDDVAPILSGDLFPNLRTLGLRNCEFADEIAAAIVDAPILDRIKVLDLSMGTLGDAGAQALVESPRITQLNKLDVHYNFCSDEMLERLQSLAVEVDISDAQGEEQEYGRYVAVGE